MTSRISRDKITKPLATNPASPAAAVSQVAFEFRCPAFSAALQVQSSKYRRLNKQILKPGFHLVNPISENVIDVDMKTSVFNLAPQQVITKDNVSMQI